MLQLLNGENIASTKARRVSNSEKKMEVKLSSYHLLSSRVFPDLKYRNLKSCRAVIVEVTHVGRIAGTFFFF